MSSIKKDILELYPEELEAELLSLGEQKFRAKQVFDWLHIKKCENFDQMSNLSAQLRNKLDDVFCIKRLNICKILESNTDDTVKYLYELSDGEHVESVLMKYKHGYSLCISTQVGCAMGCKFCASTIGGKKRDLTAGEILQEYYTAQRNLKNARISNIVLMGIGEPLDNYENVIRFIRLACHEKGNNLSARDITLSTCGIVPYIDALSLEKLPITLSISLHAANDNKRSEIMPINRKYPIKELISSCKRYMKKTNRRITFEYSLIDGVNSTKEDAFELYNLLNGFNCHINLIPINHVKERGYKSSRDAAETFKQYLINYGINATVRRTLGADIDAACGQLRRETEKISAD